MSANTRVGVAIIVGGTCEGGSTVVGESSGSCSPCGVVLPTLPAGINRSVQFNDNGYFNGVAGFEFDKVSGVLSVNLISISGNRLSGTNSRLYYNQLPLAYLSEASGSSSSQVSGVSTGTQVIGGSGLTNLNNVTYLTGNITLNIGAKSGLSLGDDTIGVNYDNTSINLSSIGKLQVFQIAASNITGGLLSSSLDNNQVTIIAGSGLKNGGIVTLGGSVTLNAYGSSGILVRDDDIIANFDNITIGLNGNQLQVIKVPNILSNGLGIDTLSYEIGRAHV